MYERHLCPKSQSIYDGAPVHLESVLCYAESYSKPLNICGLTKGATGLISVAKYSSNDRPHADRAEKRARRIRVKSNQLTKRAQKQTSQVVLVLF